MSGGAEEVTEEDGVLETPFPEGTMCINVHPSSGWRGSGRSMMGSLLRCDAESPAIHAGGHAGPGKLMWYKGWKVSGFRV